MPEERHLPAGHRKSVRVFLCGDVMCGRGIDQVLAHPCSPEIYEHYLRSAEGYVLRAEQANGPIPRRNGSSYVWGAALGQLERMQPDARIVNLETAVTRSHDRVNKGINYRVSPENAECLAAAKINCCVLANNHVLDWGRAGLLETLTTLAETQRQGDRRRTQRSRSACTRSAEPWQSAAPDLCVWIDIERYPARVGCDTRRSRRKLAARPVRGERVGGR